MAGYLDNDNVAIKHISPNGDTTSLYVGTYLPFEEDIPLQILRVFVKHCSSNGLKFIVGCDANVGQFGLLPQNPYSAILRLTQDTIIQPTTFCGIAVTVTREVWLVGWYIFIALGPAWAILCQEKQTKIN